MKKTILTTLILSLVFSGVILASGSSSGPSPARDSFSEQAALRVTHTVQCVVTEIRADGTILVRDSQERPAHALPYGKKTRFMAQSKKDFDGRKKLAATDLKVGQKIKVTLVPETMEVLRVKVLKASKS